MRWFVFVSAVFVTTLVSADGQAPVPARTGPVGAAEGLFTYKCERGSIAFQDILRLQSGRQLCGKVMEWADQFLLFDGHGNVTAYDVGQVQSCEYRRALRHTAKPALPDLTVAYVERLPRDPSWQGHVRVEGGVPKVDIQADGVQWHPTVGQKVSFRVHILNAGGAKSSQVTSKMAVDGNEIATGAVPALESGQEHVLEASWAWQEGSHTLEVRIDPEAAQKEIVRWNNTFIEPTQALSVAVVVDRERYEAFSKTSNVVDSYCFEDWIQYQIRCMNGLFRASVYPSAPQGVLERVRCDRIIVADAPTDDRRNATWAPALRRGGNVDGLAEEAALLLIGKPSESEDLTATAIKVDWSLLQKLGREIGLVSLAGTDTRPTQCRVLDQYERYAVRQHLFPWPRTLMHTAAGFTLSEVCTGYLNQAIGKPRGYRGEFLYQLPQKIAVEVRSNSGAPLDSVQIDAFQLQAEGDNAGYIAGVGRDPLYSATTGSDGRLELPNLETPSAMTAGGYELRPNPFGKIACDGSNGLLLLRLRHAHESVLHEEFHFLRLFDCNLAYLRGDRELHVHPIGTRFPDAGAPLAPPFTLIVMDDRSKPKPEMKLRWRSQASLLTLEEFRVYERVGLGGDGETPWTLASSVRKTGRRWDLSADATYFDLPRGEFRYSPDTSYAITAVDKQGRESGLGGPTFLASDKQCLKFAIDTDSGFMTLRGDGAVQMLHWDANIGTQPFAVNTAVAKNYKPGFSGIAITPEHRVLVSDPLNHVLAVYDLQGNLEEIMPRREWWPGFPSDKPGEFYDPADVAVDDKGRIYVADRGNNRVQILDSRGQFVDLLDKEFGFLSPYSVAFSNDHLCVTDKDGTRVRVYKLEGEKPVFERELPVLSGADRAVVSKSGKVYLTGEDPVSHKRGVLIFTPEGQSARLDSAVFEGEMGKVFDPRGAYFYGHIQDDFLYVMNGFPYDIRRFRMN